MNSKNLFSSTLVKVAFDDLSKKAEESWWDSWWNDLSDEDKKSIKSTAGGLLGGAGVGALSGIGTDKKLRNSLVGGLLGGGGGYFASNYTQREKELARLAGRRAALNYSDSANNYGSINTMSVEELTKMLTHRDNTSKEE